MKKFLINIFFNFFYLYTIIDFIFFFIFKIICCNILIIALTELSPKKINEK